MSIKLLLGSILLAAVPASIVALVNASLAGSQSHAALETQAQNQLVAIRDTERMQIEDFFKRIHSQVVLLSESQGVREALDFFKASHKFMGLVARFKV